MSSELENYIAEQRQRRFSGQKSQIAKRELTYEVIMEVYKRGKGIMERCNCDSLVSSVFGAPTLRLNPLGWGMEDH